MADRHYTDRHPDILPDVPMKADDEPPTWLDKPGSVNRIVLGVYAICALLLIIDPLVHKHGGFEIKQQWGSFGINWMLSAAMLALGVAALWRLHVRASAPQTKPVVDAFSIILVLAALGVIAATVYLDPLMSEKGPFAIEHWYGFYGIYGFVGCVVLVLAAKEMRRLIMMPEDYWETLEGKTSGGEDG